MNFFHKKNRTLVAFDDTDWQDENKLRSDLRDLLATKDCPELRVTAKTMPKNVSLAILQMLLAFSRSLQKDGKQLHWVLNPDCFLLLRGLGLDAEMGTLESEEITNG